MPKPRIKVLQSDFNRILKARGGLSLTEDSFELVRIELGLSKEEWSRSDLVWGEAAEGVQSRLNPRIYPE